MCPLTFAHHLSDSCPTVSLCALWYASKCGPMCGTLGPFLRRGAIGCVGTAMCVLSDMAVEDEDKIQGGVERCSLRRNLW